MCGASAGIPGDFGVIFILPEIPDSVPFGDNKLRSSLFTFEGILGIFLTPELSESFSSKSSF